MGRREKPIDPGAGPVQRFAFELRKLRQEADGPTYREMARAVPYSIAALARAAAGETLPSLPLALAYVKACDGDAAEWERRWHAIRAEEAAEARTVDEETADPPYRGLSRFEPGDHARFFGRTRLTDNLTALTRAHRCVIVLGPSGSGKSSLLRAGLVPRLRTTQDPALRPAAIRILTPGPRPFHEHRKLFAPAPGAGDTWLVVDQFEEIFTLCHDPVERRDFTDLVLSARHAGSGLRVVVGVRADFYARCLEHDGLVDVLGEASLPVGSMTPDELREVIVKPAAAGGLIVERALTARLVEETSGEPGALPLLSHTLLETWRARFYADQFTGHSEPVNSTAFSRGGRALATAGLDHSVKLWDTRSHRLLATLNGHTDLVNTVAFSPDGRTVASAGNDRSVKLWDARSHRLLATMTGHTNTIEDIAFSPDGRELASAASDRTVRLWDVRTHRERTVLTGHTDGVMRLAYSPDGRTLASADSSRTTRLWDTTTHKSSGVLAGDTGATNAVAFAPDGRTLATASTDHEVKLWGVRSRRLLTTLSGHRDDIQEVAFSPDGRTLASASLDGSVRLWRPRQRTALATLTVAGPVYGLAFSPDGRTLASTGKGSTALLWNMATRRHSTLAGRTGTTTADASFAEPRTFLSVDHDNLVTRWSTAAPRAEQPSLSHRRSVKATVTSGDGRRLATVDRDGVIRVWDLTTGMRIATLPRATVSATAWRMSMTPDGHTLAVTGNDGTIRIGRVGARRPTAVLHSPDAVLGLALRPDGRALASVSADGTTRLWNVGSERTGAPLPGPKDATRILSFSPDGRTLAVGNTDNSVRLWNAATRRATATLTTNDGLTRAMAFSPDGSTFAHGDTAHVWSTDPEYVATRVCRISTTHHWAQLLPDQPVRDLCP